MEILSSRTLLISRDPVALTAFYRDRLGLAIAREYPGGTVFHAGTSLIEIPAHMATSSDVDAGDVLWLQVRDVAATAEELGAAGVPIVAGPETKPWGLIEMTASDPDGRRLIVVEIPADHPLRRDVRE
ncbi:VOC family protein [Gordonia neofelifaecis]|uniref:Glyoxalase/bleomycin resistance protein/dioxygenase n=1 Tax=Gordonia neofelifaecis NRRL B-59395 TaxID=644548 RepID=F1YJI1_9ACTN|nr:VOC family protein [Gordonia neofelifaecis]EGD55214.1 glyoxalase/bleomycin resistance protein/dioxygenase [Gordonia neofelifaecis NRRL B-59395]